MQVVKRKHGWQTILVLGLEILTVGSQSVASPSSSERWPTIFISACRVDAVDRSSLPLATLGVSPGEIWAYVFSLGRYEGELRAWFSLYQIYEYGGNPKGYLKEFIVELGGKKYIYERLTGIEFSKAHPEGWAEYAFGIMSILIQKDVIEYLQSKPFTLTNDWISYIRKNYGKIPVCQIDFKHVREYQEHMSNLANQEQVTQDSPDGHEE